MFIVNKFKLLAVFIVLFVLAVAGCTGGEQAEEEPGTQQAQIEKREVNMQEMVDEKMQEQNFLMGQKPELVKELEIEPEISYELAVGEDLLALIEQKEHEKSEYEAVFLDKKDTREVNRITLGQSGAGERNIEFWGNFLVVSEGDSINIYKITKEETEEVWSGIGNYYLSGVSADYLINYGDGINVLEIKNGEVSLCRSFEDTGEVDDVVSFEDKFLAAAEKRGWFMFGENGEVHELKPAGARSETGEYKFYGVTEKNTLLASAETSGGSWYQLWSLKDENPRLIAENLLRMGEISNWAGEEEKSIGDNFAFHPETSKWLSYRNFEVYGADYSVVEIDENEVSKALGEDRYGEKAQYKDKNNYIPLSDYIKVKDIGPRAFIKPASVADVSGDNNVEFLASQKDGWYLVGERKGEVENIRLTSTVYGGAFGRAETGKLCKLDKKAYFLMGKTLVAVDFEELTEVERSTVYPSLEEKFQRNFGDRIAGIHIGEELFAINTSSHDKEKLTVFDRESGKEEYNFEREGGKILWADNTVFYWNPETAMLQAFEQGKSEITWEKELKGIGGVPGSETGDISAGDNHIYAATSEKDVFSLNGATGEGRWLDTIEGKPQEAVFKNGRYYVKTESTLYIYNAESGKREYELEKGSKVLDLKNMTRSRNYLAVTGRASFQESDTYIFVFDLEKGELKWDKKAGYKFFTGAPAVAGDTLYTLISGSENGGSGMEGPQLAAFDLESGEKRLTATSFPFYVDSTYGGNQCDFVYHDKTVYTGDRLGYLYALDTGGNLKKMYNSGTSPYYQARVAPETILKEKDGTLYHAMGSRLSVIK